MRIFKMLSVAAAVVLLVPFAAVNSSAAENIDRYNEEYDFESFLSLIDGDAAEILSEIGIDELSFDDVFSVEPSKVFSALFNIVGDCIGEPLRFLVLSTGILMLTSFMASICESSLTLNIVGGGALSLCAAVPLVGVVTTAFSVLGVLNTFTTAFAGVFCAVVSSAGNVGAGVSYASATVFSDALFNALLTGVCRPVSNSMCAFAFLSCFDTGGFTPKFSGIVKKIYVFFLSFIGTVFSGIVTLKGVLSNGADTLGSRSIRFVVGRSLPVVGGTVSETYSTLISSLSLIKNTVGVFGIITVVVTVLPILLRLFMWIAALEISSTVSDVLGSGNSVSMLGILKDVLVLLVATVTVVATVFIVNVGVVIAVKGGGV